MLFFFLDIFLPQCDMLHLTYLTIYNPSVEYNYKKYQFQSLLGKVPKAGFPFVKHLCSLDSENEKKKGNALLPLFF